jgi:hypothetical protein
MFNLMTFGYTVAERAGTTGGVTGGVLAVFCLIMTFVLWPDYWWHRNNPQADEREQAAKIITLWITLALVTLGATVGAGTLSIIAIITSILLGILALCSLTLLCFVIFQAVHFIFNPRPIRIPKPKKKELPAPKPTPTFSELREDWKITNAMWLQEWEKRMNSLHLEEGEK